MEKPNRFYSKKQENAIAKTLGLKRTPNSGATTFAKGDVTGEDILIEAKTLTKQQLSHTIKKEWITKNKEEAFSRGKHLSALAFDFGDNERWYIIDELTFQQFYSAYRREQEE